MTDHKSIKKILLSMSEEERKRLLPGVSEKEFAELLALSDADFIEMFRLIEAKEKPSSAEKPDKSVFWFDQDICGLTKEGSKLLQELESGSRGFGGTQVNPKQIRYLKALKKMRLRVPDFFRSSINPKALYRNMVAFCEDHDIPKEIVSRLVPAFVTYIKTGHMRPILIVGEKGCGKTTAIRLLAEMALRLPTKLIKIPQTDWGHGMTGTCDSYKSADAGSIAKARIQANSIIVVYVFDEIDKGSHPIDKASVEDELLSITDDSRSDVYDNFLETSLVGLEYCPMFFTANDLQKISPILVDRCTVVQFPNASSQRIKSISKKYAADKLATDLYSMISFDYQMMFKSIDYLVGHNITSLRKHQQLIESVLEKALDAALVQESNEPVAVTEEMFTKAEQEILGIEKRQVGFSVR